MQTLADISQMRLFYFERGCDPRDVAGRGYFWGAGYTAIKVSNLSIIDFPLDEGESYMNTVETSAIAQEKL